MSGPESATTTTLSSANCSTPLFVLVQVCDRYACLAGGEEKIDPPHAAQLGRTPGGGRCGSLRLYQLARDPGAAWGLLRTKSAGWLSALQRQQSRAGTARIDRDQGALVKFPPALAKDINSESGALPGPTADQCTASIPASFRDSIHRADRFMSTSNFMR